MFNIFKKVVFSFEKGSNGQSHCFSGSHHLQTCIQAVFSTAASSQRFSFFTVSLVSLVRWPNSRNQREHFWNLGLQIAGKCIFLDFFLILRLCWGSWLERFLALSFMSFCTYLNQSIRRIREKNGKFFQYVS